MSYRPTGNPRKNAYEQFKNDPFSFGKIEKESERESKLMEAIKAYRKQTSTDCYCPLYEEQANEYRKRVVAHVIGGDKYKKDCPHCKTTIYFESNSFNKTCTYCEKQFCFNCNSEWHDGYTCQQYQAYKQLSGYLRNMITEAQTFVKNNINADCYSHVQFNSLLAGNCPAMKKFQNAPEFKRFRSVHESGFFTWHGSSDAGVQGICNQGFNPGYRKGQVHGRGEYFGLTPKISTGYSKNGGHLIVTYILNSNHQKKVEGYCWVIDNPAGWSYSYCLPLLIVTLKGGQKVNYVKDDIKL
ncbi:RBR-type E3 ubiquitin transferase [Entamoeba marina]